MGYEISLFDQQFLRRAIESGLEDWTAADPLPASAVELVRERLVAEGFLIECDSDDFQEWVHPNEKWGLQVSIFPNQIAYAIPYWNDCENAIAYAMEQAQEAAALTGLGYHDPQQRDSEPHLSEVRKSPNRFFRIAVLTFLAQFLGCGLAVIVNLFFPFLGDQAFAIIGLVLMAEVIVLFVVGISIQLISGLRAFSKRFRIQS